MKILLISLYILLSHNVLAQQSFINPIKVGNYYEFLYDNFDPPPIRYSVTITKDTIINGILWYEYKIVNEPPSSIYYEYYRMDTNSLMLYKYESFCPDSLGSSLFTGFNLPEGYIWNTCGTGAYFRSQIIDTFKTSGFFNDTTVLRRVVRKDTVGNPVDIMMRIHYSEKFGMLQFYGSSGDPLGGGPYVKSLVGAIIDSVVYGSILLKVTPISSTVPITFLLKQNFPNPFNPSTKIRFDVPKSTHVKLKVFDMLGKEVSELVNESLKTGSYETTFNASHLTNGVYLYRIETKDYSETRKMLLIK